MIRRSLLVLLLAWSASADAQVVSDRPAQADRLDATSLMRTVEALSSPEMEGRRTATPGGSKARAWVLAAMKDTGLAPAGSDYSLPFSFTPKTGVPIDGVNIAVLCPGTDPGLPVTVVSAHYDHLGMRDGQIYRGADDNTSGVAVLLEIARRCARTPFRHPTIFVAFDAEELGLQGARAFLASPPVPRDRIGLNVNLDMVARGDKGELYVAGTHHTPALLPVLQPVASRAPIKVLFGHDRPGTGSDDWTSQSDHGPFHAAGIPFIYFGVEDHPDYHQPTDTADRIDPVFFRNAAQTILEAIVALDRRPSVR